MKYNDVRLMQAKCKLRFTLSPSAQKSDYKSIG